MKICAECGQEIDDSAQYCSSCGVEVTSYPKPAGFWIRVVASLIDFLVFIPLVVFTFYNFLSIKSTFLLILTGLPHLVYKPFMESFYGATLGKMVCGVRVIDEQGEKLTLGMAYVRFLPAIISSIIGLVSVLILFSSPGFRSASTLLEIAQLQKGDPIKPIRTIINLFVLVDCVVVAFTYRKRAIHDMMAGSFCVFKQS